MTSLGICTDNKHCHELRNAIISGLLTLAITLLNNLPENAFPTPFEVYRAARLASIVTCGFWAANKTLNKEKKVKVKELGTGT